MALEKIYSVKSAAEQLGGISRWTVYAWLSDGRLRGVKLGRRIMIMESELERLIKNNAKPAAAKG